MPHAGAAPLFEDQIQRDSLTRPRSTEWSFPCGLYRLPKGISTGIPGTLNPRNLHPFPAGTGADSLLPFERCETVHIRKRMRRCKPGGPRKKARALQMRKGWSQSFFCGASAFCPCASRMHHGFRAAVNWNRLKTALTRIPISLKTYENSYISCEFAPVYRYRDGDPDLAARGRVA